MDAQSGQGATQGPKEQLVVLIRLQALDKERDANVRLVEKTADVVQARRADVDAQQQKVAQAEAALKEARKHVDAAELDLKSRTDQVHKLELQLNTAKTNQEYQALQGYIAKLREESSTQEDQALGLYDRIEELQDAVAAAKERLKAKQAEFEAFVVACERDKEEAEVELLKTEGRRKALLEELPKEVSSLYERIRDAREGVGINPVDHKTCEGCGLTVTANDMAGLLSLSRIITCKSCGRILYLPASLSPSG